MIRETYRGCKIRTANGRRGYTRLTVNGVVLGEYPGTQEHVLATAKGSIDLAQDAGAQQGRYGAEWYQPGTFDLCPEGHVIPLGGECGRQECPAQRERAARPAPRLLGHLRRGEARPVKTGRAARVLVGTFKAVGRRRSVAESYVARRALARFVLVEIATAHNDALDAAGYQTAAAYLRDVVRADEDYVKTYASAFGRKAAEAYRRIFGAEPAGYGLAVIGHRRLRFTSIAVYGPHARIALDEATTTHKKTAALLGLTPAKKTAPKKAAAAQASAASAQTPAAATIKPAQLAKQLSDRYFERTPGKLRTVCRRYVAERVAEIAEGMRRTRANYDAATGLLTEAGAALVSEIAFLGAGNDWWRAIGAILDEQACRSTTPIGA